MKWVIAVFAFAFLLTRPFQWPPKSDAENYVEVSGSLLRGEGFINAPPYQDWNTYYVEWTPLYPLILAGIRLIGIDLHVGIRVLHAACYALTVALVWQSLSRWRLPLTLALFTPAFTYVYGFAYSEAVFNLFVVAFLLLMFRRPLPLLALSILATLIWLQRYSGAFVVMTGAAYILLRPDERVIKSE